MLRSSLRRIIPALSKANLASKCAIRPLQQSLLVSAPAKNFSTAKISCESAGLVDADLKSALTREIDYEKEEGDFEMTPEMKEYLKQPLFKILDKPGEDEVKLVRTFGNETIQLSFTIKDIDLSADSELEMGEDDEAPIPNAPIRAKINIIKEKAGAVTFDTIVEDGKFNIELVTFNKDSQAAMDDTSEAEWKRQSLYGGPVFQNLDEDLQILFERYIEERGCNAKLAHFIPNYIQYKEQKEYMQWLEDVREFVKV